MAGLLERDELLAALRQASASGGALVFVGGEAGVGKTALVRAFAEDAEGRVLRGACEHLATPTPLDPFADIASQAGGAVARELNAGADPRRVARALLEDLEHRAVAVFEDIHWADEATLDALRMLGRRLDETRGLMVATYRDDELESDHPCERCSASSPPLRASRG